MPFPPSQGPLPIARFGRPIPVSAGSYDEVNRNAGKTGSNGHVDGNEQGIGEKCARPATRLIARIAFRRLGDRENEEGRNAGKESQFLFLRSCLPYLLVFLIGFSPTVSSRLSLSKVTTIRGVRALR